MPGNSVHESDFSSAFIKDMQGRIEAALAPLLPANGEVAILDYPRYSNVGDSFIWLGTQAYLRSRGLKIRSEIHALSCDKRTLQRMIGDCPIVLQGGGNFGDIHPVHQAFRAEILTSFPRQRIVMCPQTFHYQDPNHIERDRPLYEGHPDLHLIWRDHTSLERARKAFPGARHLIAPDMAFWMDVQVAPAVVRGMGARPRILYHAHRDTKPNHLYDISHIAALGTVVQGDWRDMVGGLDIHKSFFLRATSMRKLLAGVDSCIGTTFLPSTIRRDTAIHLARSCNWLNKAIAFYARHDVILTNRLHSHMLATLLRKPHVIVDTFYGKLDWYYESWTFSDPDVRRVRHYEDVPTALGEILSQIQ